MTIFGVFSIKISQMKITMHRQGNPDPRNHSLVLYRVKVRVAAIAAATVAERAAN